MYRLRRRRRCQGGSPIDHFYSHPFATKGVDELSLVVFIYQQKKTEVGCTFRIKLDNPAIQNHQTKIAASEDGLNC